MKPLFFLLFLPVLIPHFGQSQTGFQGRVVDEQGVPLQDANVLIKDIGKGAGTNTEGHFFLELDSGSYTILISSVGYKNQTIYSSVGNDIKDLREIRLTPTAYVMNDLVVSGSRTLEKITESPAAINLIDGEQFEKFTGSPEELFALQKGVDFSRQGNFWGSISIRGFNSAFNQKMLLLDDNKIANVRIRTPVGPLSSFVKEDIERVEIVLGPSSALYGPNCLMGLFNTHSKSPFDYPGTDIVLGAGSNEVRNFRLRHAIKINNKWAYKVTFEYLAGVEEAFTDSVYVLRTSGVLEGKAELGLDRDILFLKGLGSVVYKPTPTSAIGVTYAFNESNGINGAARNNQTGWLNSNLQVSYTSPRWFAQFYKTWIKLDRTMNPIPRTINYYILLDQDQSEEEALINSLYQPNRTSNEEDSYRLNGEIQYNSNWNNWNIVAGAQYQKEVASSNQTYLLDEPIHLLQIGLYGQVIYAIGNTGIKLIATARGDNHSLFGFNFLPRTGITYTKNQTTWRVTWGEGYSNPTLINTHMNFAGGTSLGNSDGFTLSDGTRIKPIGPETMRTLEAGYKSVLVNRRLFVDADVYYNWSENMISPMVNLVPNGTSGGPVVTHRGDRPITDFTQGLRPGIHDPGAMISTNINFGKVNTYGFDVGLNYYLSDNYSLTLNYSFVDYSLDRTNPDNDVNRNGKVDDNDMAMNTPKNKVSSAFNVKFNKLYARVFARWIKEYDFFSGRHVAAATDPENIYNGTPVIEGQRVGKVRGQWNYGPLGGFYVSANGNYQLTRALNIGLYVNNIVGKGNYEFVASPPTETTFGAEVKVSLWKD